MNWVIEVNIFISSQYTCYMRYYNLPTIAVQFGFKAMLSPSLSSPFWNRVTFACKVAFMRYNDK
jgi:hypothetical protein